MAKWFVGTPATEAKKRKKNARKTAQTKQAQAVVTRTGAGSSKAADHVEATVDNDEAGDASGGIESAGDGTSDEEDMLASDNARASTEPMESRPAKRPKQLQPAEFTAYVDIISPPRTVRAKETSTTRGPFFFNAETGHLEFLGLLAACAVEPGFSASIAAINQSLLVWKLNTPANDKKKPLSSEQGYRALLNKMNELSMKKKECTVSLSMPPLTKLVDSSQNNVCELFYLLLATLI